MKNKTQALRVYLQENMTAKRLVCITLLLIIFFAIILRTYNFNSWLRFNADQARDAEIVRSIIKEGETFPLLGPRAGGTNFKLGSIFYFFQFLAGTLFGPEASVFAYPDLIFSILFVVLIFYVARELFGSRIALILAAIASFSFFFVKYGRFAWNPNSSAFFVLLFFYALSNSVKNKLRSRLLWTILAGLALGVAIQLHTFILVTLLPIAIILVSYLWRRRSIVMWRVGLILCAVLFANFTQIKHEFTSDFSNSKAFLAGVGAEGSSRSLQERTWMDSVCLVRSNVYILTAWGDSEECTDFSVAKIWQKNSKVANGWQGNIWLILKIASGGIFILGGFFFLFMLFLREKTTERSVLLLGILLYLPAVFLVMIPSANQLTLRYYLVLSFAPLLILGAWLKFVFKKSRYGGIIASCLVLVFCLGLNLMMLNKYRLEYEQGKVGDTDMSVLGEVEPLAKFIMENAPENSQVFLTGGTGYVRRFKSPLAFLVGEKNIKLEQLDTLKNGTDGKVFYINKKSSKRRELKTLEGRNVLNFYNSGKIDIFVLE